MTEKLENLKDYSTCDPLKDDPRSQFANASNKNSLCFHNYYLFSLCFLFVYGLFLYFISYFVCTP